MAFLESFIYFLIIASLLVESWNLFTKTGLFVSLFLELRCLIVRPFLTVATGLIRVLLVKELLSLLKWLVDLEMILSLLPRSKGSLLSFYHIILLISLD